MNGRVFTVLLVLLIGTLFCYVIVYRQDVPIKLKYIDGIRTSVVEDKSLTCESPRNIIFIYTGRWKFLRIQLAYIYRELHRNEGVIHEVWFMMINYEKETEQRLLKFIEVANYASKQTIFSVHYMVKPPQGFTLALTGVFSAVVRHPFNKYFKLDDDIVYIHPGAFSAMIENQNTSKCFIHFFNIAGSNWRCSWLHQQNSVYNETNPKDLVFEFNPFGKCGWRGADCAEMSLRTFLHHYKNNELEKYFLKELYLISDRKRFILVR